MAKGNKFGDGKLDQQYFYSYLVKHYQHLKTHTRGNGLSSTEREDAIQSTMLIAIERQHQLRDISKINNW